MSRGLFVLALLATPLLVAAPEEYPSPARSAERMKVPEGFRVQLVAGEPTLIKPIAATTDERGRLWVVESHSYPHWLKDKGPGKDRVLILERQRDGSFSCKVFLEGGVNLSGIAVGFGGVWLTSVPRLVFIPVKDDKPAGEPVVHLDGFTLEAKHNVVNGLAWGPDGWLYGMHGILATSHIGAPGTPADKRLPLNCGVWRYQPTRHKVEAVAWGTTNPWGMDWDENGELYITNCVIKHAFHVVPGAHFVRMYGQDLNPHVYGLIESCADHIHWGGGDWTTSRGGKGGHDAPGGGHAHAGAMFYLGDTWPAQYRNRLFMGNLHGNRLNQDEPVRSRSGYVLKHREDFLFANDEWFRPLWMIPAHDGGMYVGDWHDTGECHNYDKTHPSGRIYHVQFGAPKVAAPDLAKLSDFELVKLQSHGNEWYVRQARRLLQERAAAETLSPRLAEALRRMARGEASTAVRLRVLWALHAIGQARPAMLGSTLLDRDEAMRIWAARLLADHEQVKQTDFHFLVDRARHEKSPPVRLALASAMRKAPLELRGDFAVALASDEKDAADPNLPLMIWYGLEPAVAADPTRGEIVLTRARIPLLRQYVARRMAASERPAAMSELARALTQPGGPHRDILRGMSEALAGRRSVPAPSGWLKVYKDLSTSQDAEVRERVLALSVLFGLADALEALRRTAEDKVLDAGERSRALEVLLDKRDAAMPSMLRHLLDDAAMRGAALRGLAHYDDPKTPGLILERYPRLSDAEKADALSTLASRPAYALALLDAVEKKLVPRADVSAFTARQLASLNDQRVRRRLAAVWGDIRPTAKDKEKLLNRYLKLAAPEQREKADRSAGRLVWSKTCASCHTLFGDGGKIGPDLTGSQRANAEYVLHKVLDPNAVVPRDYQTTKVVTVTGRVLTGLIKQENDKVLTLQTATEEVRVLKSDIDEREQQHTSLMPEGQLATLSDAEVRDLLAYLTGKGQAPLPKAK